MRIEINIYDKNSIREVIRKVEETQARLNRATQVAIEKTARDIAMVARRLVENTSTDFATGGLASSWEVENGKHKATVYNEDEAAPYFEYGTGVIGKESPAPNTPSNWEFSKEPWWVHIDQWGNRNHPDEWIFVAGQRGHGIVPMLAQMIPDIFKEHFGREMRV